jgi:hypothetical protein
MTRAHINRELDKDKAVSDFQAAIEVDPKSWRARHHLIGYYDELGLSEESLALAQQAAAQFPDHIVLRVDLVRALVKNESWQQALDILETTSALPFEGAREVHGLFRQCQIQLALQKIEVGDYTSAIEYLDGSKQYPERLGTGKPYDPDFRMQDYLQALCYDKLNLADKAQAARKAIYDYTLGHLNIRGPNQYFGALILKHFGEHEKAEKLKNKGRPSQRVLDVIEAVDDPEDRLPYGVGSWDANSLGNHRVVMDVSTGTTAVAVHIPWRRRDHDPQNKKTILVDAKTGRQIGNVCAVEVNREFGDFVFEPTTAPGTYYMYYMPYEMTGRNYPQTRYLKSEQTADEQWLQGLGYRSGKLSREDWSILPKAKVVEMQSINEFNSFYPMEVIATAAETRELQSNAPNASYLLFPEDREHPIRMAEDLPLRWIEAGPQSSFHAEALKGEFYTFQIGIYAFAKAISDIDIGFSDLQGPNGSLIHASALRCFNLGGVDWRGVEFEKICPVEKGKVRALWFGIDVPKGAPVGRYAGKITITPEGAESSAIQIDLDIEDQVLADAGDGELWRHSRLRWLDSKIAMDDEPVEPFVPLTVNGTTISCLGRSVTLGRAGLPEAIQGTFAPEVTHIADRPRDVLSGSVQIVVEAGSGEPVRWNNRGPKIVSKTAGAVTWQSQGDAGNLSMSCDGRMEFDGFISYTIALHAPQPTRVQDIRLEVPVARDVAKYIMGMGLKGGLRVGEHRWKWDQKKNQDSVWVGDTNAGLQCALRAENYSRPLNTNFYLLKPLNMPPSWHNQGEGGCDIKETDDNTVLISAYSGPRTIQAGEKLYFDFNLLLTPFKTLDVKGQWATRFFHSYRPIEEIAATGANTINNHHANDANPYINYPFIHTQQMKDYVDSAHEKNMRVKIYYTVRELSNRCPELFALRSLDDEILAFGPGGGHSWLQEHLGSDYIAGWFVPRFKDAAVINSGVSRWHNYYLEGLNWLVENIGIDGLYIDDVAFDRTVMKRVRRILDRGRRGALIDLHSANQYNIRDGFVNSANLYLEHFPYIDRLWFGEYFDYNSPPDFWLVEVSGICFGLMGEMLQDGGNPWRGMLYGMTARLPWSGNPSSMWKFWDEFGIADAKMVGYWAPSCPVSPEHKDVLATVYRKKDKVLISIASWGPEPVLCRLRITWNALGINRKGAKLTAPYIEGFQDATVFLPEDEIPIAPGKGWLLVLSR